MGFDNSILDNIHALVIHWYFIRAVGSLVSRNLYCKFLISEGKCPSNLKQANTQLLTQKGEIISTASICSIHHGYTPKQITSQESIIIVWWETQYVPKVFSLQKWSCGPKYLSGHKGNLPQSAMLQLHILLMASMYIVKFSFSEKATKLCAIFLMVWTFTYSKRPNHFCDLLRKAELQQS